MVSARAGRSIRLVGPLALAVTFTVAGCGSGGRPDALAGAVITPAPDVTGVSLPDSSTGQPFRFRPAAGNLMVVYFGYTSCPDVCPLTLATLKRAIHDLGTDAGRVSVAMGTIDPRRDTAAVLKDYLGHFFDNATALRTDDDSVLRTATDAFGALYSVTVDANGEEVVRIRVRCTPSTTPAESPCNGRSAPTRRRSTAI